MRLEALGPAAPGDKGPLGPKWHAHVPQGDGGQSLPWQTQTAAQKRKELGWSLLRSWVDKVPLWRIELWDKDGTLNRRLSACQQCDLEQGIRVLLWHEPNSQPHSKSRGEQRM